MVRTMLSPYNAPFARQNAGGVSVRLRELTLRQIGHMDAHMTLDEKLYFLQRLAQVGVAESIIWGADDDAEEFVLAAKNGGIPIAIGFYGKVFFKEEAINIMDKAKRCGADFICLNARGSAFALEESGWTQKEMIAASVDVVTEAKRRDLTISLGLYGGTQSEPAFVQTWARLIASAGVDRIYCPDSLGVATPAGMANLVAMLKASAAVPIEAHCHNDFGLAVANSIAAVEAGAEFVEVAVNGMDPERSGIAALEELAVSLEMLYGVRTGIQLDGLTALSRLHEEITNMRVAENKPIVGKRAFNYRVASGPDEGSSRRDEFYSSPRVTPFDPAAVGNERAFVLGKFSGRNEVLKQLENLSLSARGDALELVIEQVKERGRAEGRSVTDADLRYFVDVATLAVNLGHTPTGSRTDDA